MITKLCLNALAFTLFASSFATTGTAKTILSDENMSAEERRQRTAVWQLSERFYKETGKFIACHGGFKLSSVYEITLLNCIKTLKTLNRVIENYDISQKAVDGFGINASFEDGRESIYFDSFWAQISAFATEGEIRNFLKRQISVDHEQNLARLRKIKRDQVAVTELIAELKEQALLEVSCEYGLPAKRCLIGLNKIRQAYDELGAFGERTKSVQFFEGGGARHGGSFLYAAVTLPYEDLRDMYLK